MIYERIVPLFVATIFCLHPHASSSQCPETASSVGREFMFGVCGVPGTSYLYVFLTSMSDTPAHVRITAPFNNYDRQYTVSNTTFVSLSTSLIQSESGRQFKGIEINSDADIAVSVIPASSSHETEGFLVLPTSALSTRYVAASYHPYSSSNEILVAGIDSNTDVLFNYTSNGKTYSTRNVRLQKFETYQLTSSHDVSGSVITSNKPIAVFAGSGYSYIPVDLGSYNYIVEQMIPKKYWTKRYIVPPFYPHNFFIVKLFADEDNTEVQYYNNTKHFAAYMDKGSFVEILFGSDPVVILATKPVSVIQYFRDGENMLGAPFMTTAQGLGQYTSSYRFYTEVYDGGHSTLAITIKRNDSSGLLLNGKSTSSLSAKTVTVSRPLEDYVTLFINVSYGTFYNLHHTGGIKFGATLYGLLSTTYAYGYPLQLSLSSNTECTVTTNIPGYTHSPHQNGSQGHQVYEVGNGTWCFQCENMSHLQYCDKVTRCHTKNEVCSIQRYTRSDNVQLYRSGCMSRDACQSYGDQVDCQECCNGSFCNVAGCGDDGLPSFQSRGPFCFDCEHQGEEVCQTIQMCRPNQVCKIEKYEWGSGYHNIMGCADYQVCNSKRDARETHARHAPVCSHCCHSDFCNMNCTAAHVQQIIG